MRPKLDAFVGVIERILEEDEARPAKQRHTSKRIFERQPYTVASNGGLDANWLVKHGVPTVTFGAGQAEIHTVNEYVEIPEFVLGCRLAVALATLVE